MQTNDWLSLSAIELSRAIRQKLVSSEEVVRLHIEQIVKVNPRLNAVVFERFDCAMEEARVADNLLLKSNEKLPVFHGVPCTIKECFSVKNMPQTSGLYARKGIVSNADSPAVQNLRSAGFIPLGVTNVSELCMWMESNNKVYGRTNNPYDPSRTVGGSSGGEGAIIGAGGSPVGLGSDIGGSIRMPAFFNGVFGHKPSPGLVSNIGQYPLAANEALDYLCTGPLCRRAEDLSALCRVLAGSKASRIKTEAIDFSTLRVLSIEDDGRIPVSTELKNTQIKVAEYLQSLGARTFSIKVDGLRRTVEVWSSMLEMAGGDSFEELLFEGERRSILRELWRLINRRSQHTFPALGLVLLEKLSKLNRSQLIKFYQLGKELQSQFASLLEGNTILLYPSHTKVAPKHGASLFTPWNWSYTAIFNCLKLPVTQVPLGLNQQSLPLGVQVVANKDQDHRCFAVAVELEKAFGGWVKPQFGSS